MYMYIQCIKSCNFVIESNKESSLAGAIAGAGKHFHTIILIIMIVSSFVVLGIVVFALIIVAVVAIGIVIAVLRKRPYKATAQESL